MQLLNAAPGLTRARRNVEWLDDFFNFVTTDFWTSDTSDDNDVTPAVGDAEHGVLTLSVTTDDNEETGIFSTREIALFQADCTIVYEVRAQYAEGNTSAANVAHGMCDAPNVDDWLSDNGGGANTTGSGMMIYKIDGGTVWRANCEINGTVKDSVSIQTAGGSSYQTLTLEARAVDSTNLEVTYYLDQLPLRDSNNVQIKHTIAYASATEMNLQEYLKAGSTTTETELIDYVYYGCLRV